MKHLARGKMESSKNQGEFYSLNFRKPNTVMAISLLLQELDNPSDLDEIKKTLKARLRKIKETDIFTVWTFLLATFTHIPLLTLIILLVL